MSSCHFSLTSYKTANTSRGSETDVLIEAGSLI